MIRVEVGKKYIEGLIAAICIFKQVSQEDYTVLDCSEGSICDFSLLPQSQEKASEYLLAVISRNLVSKSDNVFTDITQDENAYTFFIDIISFH